MAEKGSLIEDQTGGVSLAMRDALEQDDLSNARILPRMSLVPSTKPLPEASAIRSGVTAVDPPTLAALPAEITNNLLTCGDHTKLIVYLDFVGTCNGNEDIKVQVLLFDNEVTPGYIGFGEYVRAETELENKTLTDGTKVRTPYYEFDLTGAPKIGLYISSVDLQSCTHADVFAYLI